MTVLVCVTVKHQGDFPLSVIDKALRSRRRADFLAIDDNGRPGRIAPNRVTPFDAACQQAHASQEQEARPARDRWLGASPSLALPAHRPVAIVLPGRTVAQRTV